ncbi:AtpZ/AtpI family protein [Allosphingosinicella flava]|uniref:ATP synthase protein I n=1 Tax=Allosphingosinicella flava TaxID=2771430 RepID=A0A7T2LNA6_9SPHN|nr:AtpZ/AtpI family protein [Sphingosinicella flava]QPQ56183.1 AtpZ/AtpI family protein [Sphingosinicella flava]
MTEDESGQDQQLPKDARLNSLDERLRQAQLDEKVRTGMARKPGDSDYQKGNRVLADLIGGLVGGAVIGWALDQLFDTTPLLLLVFLFLGIGVAFRNIIRNSSRRPD